MLLISCPHCGPRNGDEFAYRGERLARPDADTTPDAWRAYLYLRGNAAGWQEETWFHVAGCRRFLTMERHTVTNVIRRVRDTGGLP